MEEALEAARAKDTKERMAGVERLLQVLESTTRSLSSAEVTSLVDTCMDLLKDSNFRVSQGALQALSAAAVLSGDHLKIHFNGLVPAVVERLGDGKQPVREAARQLLITLMEVSSPTIIVERAGSYAWAHRSWRVREEFARTVSTAVGLFASTELPLQRVLLPPVLQLLTDSNQSVREAAASCIEEMYAQVGTQFHEELQRHSLPSSMIKEISARLEKIEPKVLPSDGVRSHISTDNRTASASHKKSSPRTKTSTRETSFSSGEIDITEKPVVPIKVFTEKELVKEMEKITSTLVPEKDWSHRISAMQRVEGLVIGGAADYQSFPMLLKQLVPPICTQLLDRRSSIVKQACHLLNLLSKESLGDFEACAETFIPVLLKLVVITVLVIAESADHCIKTMLRNCKVARILPRIAEIAKSDKSSVLRARCCDYALLILEYWADAPEIQRAADLYEELIKCCVADAMSEVRSTARTCYRMFTKTWPERSRRLFLSFDPAIQRLINEEDGSIHKRHASPSIRERGLQLSHSSSQAISTGIPGYGTSAIVAMDKGATSSVGTSLSSASLLSQSKMLRKNPERTLESVLDASKQKVSAIESLLKGVSISEKQSFTSTRSTSLDLGVDAPSTRDPQVPSSVSSNLFPAQGLVLVDSNAANIAKGNNRNGGSNMSELLTSQVQSSRDSSKSSYFSPSDTLSALSLSYMKRSERLQEGSGIEDNVDLRFSRRISSMQIDKQYLETPYKDSFYRESPNSYIPNFQRPLLRKQVTGRAIASSRKSFDDSQIQGSEIHSYMDGPASLNDALNEGLSPSSDWVARVSAFNFLRSLLQQGPKGILEITQHFEKVMKLFFRYLDDPHHKVAQAAFSTLAEIIPVCRKPFESYLERTLPHVFSRLIDPKELVRQPCSTTLEIVSKTYNVDSLLPALVRSLDEQRSPKAKLAVIQFANNSFNKHTINPEGNSNSGFIKLWLGKLSPWVNDKNVRLKEASISGIISVYTHFDSTAVLNFILSLSVEEQNSLRRALKQYTPRIEVDLMNFLQNKKERQRSKSFYDQSDVVGSSSEEGYVGGLKKGHQLGRYSAGSLDDEGGRKWSLSHESTELDTSIVHVTSNEIHHSSQNLDEFISDPLLQGSGSGTNCLKKTDYIIEHENSVSTPRLSINRFIGSDGNKPIDLNHGGEISKGSELKHLKNSPVRANLQGDSGPSIPQLLHQICNTSDVNSNSDKTEALQQLVEISSKNDSSVWTKYFNQILTAVLEVLDDSDPSTRELALSLIFGMLNNQKSEMEDSVEIVIEKLLHVTKDVAVKVSKEANQCLNVVLSEYDPFRFFSVIVPLLVSDDEKTLVVCISCLTKLVSRLPQDDLMKHLPSFLPALFDAFGNQSPDVRKTVVFCLVEIYIKLGKSFLPYLEGLSSTQLRLVTIYANRISQARSGAPIDSSH